VSDDVNSIIRDNKALLEKWIEATNNWDIGLMGEILHPDATIELPWTIEPFPTKVSGYDNILRFTASVPDFALSENLHDFEVHAFADDPNELYMEFKSDMTLKSGREYKNDYLARMTIKDGKVFRFVEYPEPIRLLRALGGSVNPPTDRPNIEHGA